MEDRYIKLKQILGSRLKINETLAPYTTFKIGGPADCFYIANTIEDLTCAIKEARLLQIPVTIIGMGSNILISDKGVRGLVIKNATKRIALGGIKGKMQKGKYEKQVFVEADSGVIFNKLVRFTIDEGLEGLQMHLGLPGTVGGAIYMNSKWMHPTSYVGSVVYQAKIFTPDNQVRIVPKSYFQFGYGASKIQKTNDYILSITFSLKPASKEKLWQEAEKSIKYRRETQPSNAFTAGCVFKNISPLKAKISFSPNHATSAGFLLEKAGLKGLRYNDAEISSVHANFIVNHGSAKAAHVIKLIERAKEQVKEKFSVSLDEEIIRIGEF